MLSKLVEDDKYSPTQYGRLAKHTSSVWSSNQAIYHVTPPALPADSFKMTEAERPRVMSRDPAGRGLHSSTVHLTLSRFGHTSPCPPV